MRVQQWLTRAAGPMAIALLLGSALTAQAGPYRKGDRVPDFLLPDANGKKVRLSQFKGKPVLLNFFGYGCDSCHLEAPHLERDFHRRYGRQLQVIGIMAFTPINPMSKAKQFRNQYGLTYPILVDARNRITDKFGVDVTPTNILLDRQGKISAVILDYQPEALRKAIVPQIALHRSVPRTRR